MTSKLHVTVSLRGGPSTTDNDDGGDAKTTTKDLVIHEDVAFDALVRKIAALFGVAEATPESSRLLLGGDVPIEDTSEIDDGDALVLDCGAGDGHGSGTAAGAEAKGRSKRLADADADDDDDSDDDSSYIEDVTDQYLRPGGKRAASIDDADDDDSDVEDVTDQYQTAKEEEMRRMAEEAECIGGIDDSESSMSSSTSSDDDGSSYGPCDSDEDWAERPSPRPRKTAKRNKPKAKTAAADDDGKPTGKRKPRKRSTAKAKKKKVTESPLEVIMEEKDVPAAPGTNEGDMDDSLEFQSGSALGGDAGGKRSADDVDRKTKDRIIKLLNTGFHETSNEHEAKNAMKLARRLMQRHNLSQAVLLRERDGGDLQNEGSLKGGLVAVKIVNRKTQKSLGALPRWTENLIPPVCQNFGVEAYKTVSRGHGRWRPAECSVTFYGIYTNAQLAAYAFKIATERIATMAAEYDPQRNDLDGRRRHCASVRSRAAAATKTARLSYALGVVKGLARDVEETKRREEERRKQKLEKARRAAASTREAYEESDDDDGDREGFSFAGTGSAPQSPTELDGSSSLDVDNLKKEGLSSSASGSTRPSGASVPANGPLSHDNAKASNRLKELEKEESAALALCDHRSRIAEDVLKQNNVKVRKAAKRKAINFDRKAYVRGIEDAKEIDLNQRAIRGSAQHAKEELQKRARAF